MEYKGIAEELPGLSTCLGALRSAYVQMSERYGHRAQRERDKASWDALARFLMNTPGADPYDYVRFVFKFYTPLHDRPVFENMLLSAKTISGYRQQIAEREEELTLILRLQVSHLKYLIGRGHSLSEALSQGEFNAAFSYSVAKAVGDDALAAGYEDEARFQVRFNPFYRRHFSRWLSEGNVK